MEEGGNKSIPQTLSHWSKGAPAAQMPMPVGVSYAVLRKQTAGTCGYLRVTPDSFFTNYAHPCTFSENHLSSDSLPLKNLPR